VLTGVLFLLLFLHAVPSLGEVSVSFSPAVPRVGDYVDVTVSTDSGTVRGARYRLSLNGEKVFSSRKTESRLSASFRPRKEGSWTLEVTLTLKGNVTETASVTIPVADAAPEQRGKNVVYSQMDGWWRGTYYSKEHNRTLESSGCSVFAVSHALQRLGFDSDEALPDRLAWTFHKCYIEGVGTGTEALVTQAGLYFGFDTAHKPVTAEDELIAFLKRGDLFCLGIVNRHVVLADGIDEESRKVHIVDSAPGATFSRLKPTAAYIRGEDGSWQTIRSAEELPGIRWFFETSQYGGAEYWLDLKDCASRGMRLIRKPWLTLAAEDGETAVSPDWFGTLWSSVTAGGETRTVSTGSLRWLCDGADGPRLAVVTRERGAVLTSRQGTAVANLRPVPWGRVLCALSMDEERVYVYWRGVYGYVKRSDVEMTGVPEQAYPFTRVTAEGKSEGAVVRSYRQAEPSGAAAAEWAVGTEVVILDRADGFCLVEGLGTRGWIPEKNLTSVP
jgi:hypothetical protein